ncbi:MAG: hypothetical protein ACKVW3_16475 [Phycisphaerales bacterium]
MLKSLVVAIVGLAFMFLTTGQAQAASTLKLQAVLRGSATATKAVAKYEEKPRGNLTEQRFKVQVERATPGAQLPVFVNTTQLGMITINQFGRGQIDLRVNSDNPGTSVPSLPFMKAGDQVRVGAMTGAFVRIN